jgi:hypothetical protein
MIALTLTLTNQLTHHLMSERPSNPRTHNNVSVGTLRSTPLPYFPSSTSLPVLAAPIAAQEVREACADVVGGSEDPVS